MERIDRRALLYDFYGELLTDHQKEVYEYVVYEDLSLGEIAEKLSISRQGVYDLLRRCDKLLEGYEQKLHLIARFHTAKESIEEIRQIAQTAAAYRQDETYERILKLAGQVQDVL